MLVYFSLPPRTLQKDGGPGLAGSGPLEPRLITVFKKKFWEKFSDA
jgi:hypothetical protein